MASHCWSNAFAHLLAAILADCLASSNFEEAVNRLTRVDGVADSHGMPIEKCTRGHAFVAPGAPLATGWQLEGVWYDVVGTVDTDFESSASEQ